MKPPSLPTVACPVVWNKKRRARALDRMYPDGEFRHAPKREARVLLPLQQLTSSDKDIDHRFFLIFVTSIIMADNSIVHDGGSNKCLRFGDGTPPLCHASNQLGGHLCQPCSREHQAAQATFEGSGPQARRELLQRENLNLRLASAFASIEYEAEVRCTEAWRRAVAAKVSERDALIRQRDRTE